MKKNILVLFGIPIFVVFLYDSGFLLGSAYDASLNVWGWLALSSFVMGLYFYVKLFSLLKESIFRSKLFLVMWILMIFSFVIVPLVYAYKNNSKITQIEIESQVYYREKCKIEDRIEGRYKNKVILCPDFFTGLPSDVTTVEEYIKKYKPIKHATPGFDFGI